MNLRLPKQKTAKGSAQVWKRVFAFIVDFFLLNYIIVAPVFNLISDKIRPNISFGELIELVSSSDFSYIALTISFWAGILCLLYFFMLEKKFGQTVGKMLFNIRVESEFKEMKFWQLIVRSLFVFPVFPFVLLWIIDPIFILINKDKKRLSEIISNTKVVEIYYY